MMVNTFSQRVSLFPGARRGGLGEWVTVSPNILRFLIWIC